MSRIPDVLAGAFMLLVASVMATAAVLLPETTFTARWGGDQGKDIPSAIVSDGRQRVFVVGSAHSADFPVTAGPRRKGRGWCVFGTALNTTAGSLLYSTAACNEGDTWGRSADVSLSGELWAAGATNGSRFPVTTDAHQGRYGGSNTLRGPGDAFLLRWSADGRSIQYATYLGGAGDDEANAVLDDRNGGAWIGGSTASPGFPNVTVSSQPASAYPDAFVAHIDPQGRLAESIRFGGPGDDRVLAMTWTADDRIVLVGTTTSTGDAFGGEPRGGLDSFAVAIDPVSETIMWQQRVGGQGDDSLRAVAVLPNGHVVATGQSASATCAGYGGKTDGWILVLSETGSPVREFCTGGRESDSVHGMTVDERGRVWMTGVTSSRDFPLTAQEEEARALACCREAFVAEISVGERRVHAGLLLLGTDRYPRSHYSEGHAVTAIAGGIVATGEFAPQSPGRAKGGGEIRPSEGAVGYGESFNSTDPYVVGFRLASDQ